MSEEQNPGLIGEIVDGLHNLEEKVEHMIHGDSAPSSTEPVQEAGGAAAGESSIAASEASGSTLSPITGDAALATTGDPMSTNTATQAGDFSVTTDTTPAMNDAPAVAASGEIVGGAVGGETGVSATAVEQAATPSAQTGDDPNAAAPTAGDSSASDTQSSASPVSQVGEGLAIAASVSEAVVSRLYVLRKHFWTFEESARAPFIKLLDEIEALVK